MSSQIYIHYGNDHFDPTKNFPMQNINNRVKPKGGLWASRINAKFGWKDWCSNEKFSDCDELNSFKFTIKHGFKVYTIETLFQLYKLPKLDCSQFIGSYCIDFEKCLKSGIDAIELFWYGDHIDKVLPYDSLHYQLYNWDCDSIVVLNHEAIHVL